MRYVFNLELLKKEIPLVGSNVNFYNAEDRPILILLCSEHARQEYYEGDRTCDRQINPSFVPGKTPGERDSERIWYSFWR